MIQQRLIWSGRPSQWINAKFYVKAFFFLVIFIVLEAAGFFNAVFSEYLPELMSFKPLIKTILITAPFIYGAWRWLLVHLHQYELTEEVFREHYGVFNRVTHELELYRVIDTLTYKPFDLNVMKLGNVVMNTSDASDPVAYILAVPYPDELRKIVRQYVELNRERKGIVEVANR